MNQLSNLYARYAATKTAWIEAHPDACPEQIERAARGIARRMGL